MTKRVSSACAESVGTFLAVDAVEKVERVESGIRERPRLGCHLRQHRPCPWPTDVGNQSRHLRCRIPRCRGFLDEVERPIPRLDQRHAGLRGLDHARSKRLRQHPAVGRDADDAHVGRAIEGGERLAHRAEDRQVAVASVEQLAGVAAGTINSARSRAENVATWRRVAAGEAQLLYLDSADPSKDIQVYFNSPGGSVHAGLGIYDTMQYIKCDIATLCMGQAASMGALLLAAGTEGKRYALPNSRIMIHQPMGGFQGQATDIDIHAKHILKTKNRLNKILAKHTGQKMKKVEEDSDRDYFMSAEEAKKYGIIDKII